MSEKWYQNAIVYAVDVATFYDSDDDGVGDFQGLIARLPYLHDLGITCIWLLPFYPSPDLDNGYAITHFRGVDKRQGTLDDFREFIHKAHQYGIRVLIDLVVNHTSDQHFWFQDALNDANSKYHPYYIWSQEKPDNMAPQVIFPGQQEANWTYNEVAEAYYWHFFYKFQPGLNHSNPQVRREVENIVEFWLKFGVDGFRVDALPMIIAEKGFPTSKPEHGHEVIRHLVAFAKVYNPDAIFLAEANVEPDEMVTYFGNGNEMDLLFNFYLNSYFFLAFARQDAETMRQAWHHFSDKFKHGHWLNFVRTLDELSIERLTVAEQQEVFDALAPDEKMQIFNRGIRRRLPPIVNNNRRQLEMVYSFFFALPGIPMLVYGEEIGMGDNLDLDGRMSVRTPMQWSSAKNSGFSTADSHQLARPIIKSGEYGYENINVEKCQQDENSLWHWMKKLMQVRKAYPLLGKVIPELYQQASPVIFGLLFKGDSQYVLTLHNFSDKSASIQLDNLNWQPLLADTHSPKRESNSTTIELAPYGYQWLCLAQDS